MSKQIPIARIAEHISEYRQKIKNMKILVWSNSNQINATKYIPDTKILEVEFKTGAVYQYFKVPNEIWEDLEKQKKEIPQYSVGNWLNKIIKGKFEYLKIR